MFPNTIVGSVTGTGAAINVEVGFLPDKVVIVNQTTGRTLTWYRSQAAGAGLVGGTAAGALIGANGISSYNGAPNAGLGFTIGTDAVNAAGNVLAYEVLRSGPGAK